MEESRELVEFELAVKNSLLRFLRRRERLDPLGRHPVEVMEEEDVGALPALRGIFAAFHSDSRSEQFLEGFRVF